VVENQTMLNNLSKKREEVQFDIRQEAFGARYDAVEPQSDDDLEKLKSLGIELDDDFQSELMTAYDDYSNFIR
jgi:hypothetical protein